MSVGQRGSGCAGLVVWGQCLLQDSPFTLSHLHVSALRFRLENKAPYNLIHYHYSYCVKRENCRGSAEREQKESNKNLREF